MDIEGDGSSRVLGGVVSNAGIIKQLFIIDVPRTGGQGDAQRKSATCSCGAWSPLLDGVKIEPACVHKLAVVELPICPQSFSSCLVS